MSDLIGNPEDWFSHNEAHMKQSRQIKVITGTTIAKTHFANCHSMILYLDKMPIITVHVSQKTKMAYNKKEDENYE